MILITKFLQEPDCIAGFVKQQDFGTMLIKEVLQKLIQTWMKVFEVPHKNAANISRPRQEIGPPVLGGIPERTVIGPVLQFIVAKIMGITELILKFLHRVRPEQYT